MEIDRNKCRSFTQPENNGLSPVRLRFASCTLKTIEDKKRMS